MTKRPKPIEPPDSIAPIIMAGRLPSYRDKRLSSKIKAVSDAKWSSEQQEWAKKLLPEKWTVIEWQTHCALFGKKIKIDAKVYRATLIQDKKNYIVPFDHLILDSMTKMKMIFDDCETNLEYHVKQVKVDLDAEEKVVLRISISDEDCSPSFIKKARVKERS